MVMHVGLNGYDSEYQIRPESTGNTSDSSSSTTRGTLFSYTSGGAGLANIFRAQIGGEAATSADYHAQSPSTSDVKNRKGGLEGIFAYNNFKLQGEWGTASYDAKTQQTGEALKADVDTWYAEALWTLTGEKYADQYKKGAFGLAKPANEFNMDTGTGWGLWEASFRVDAFDVSNGDITGTSSDATRFQGGLNKYSTNTTPGDGKLDTCSNKTSSGGIACATGVSSGAQSYTAGIKWVWNPNLLFKANYTYTKFDHAVYPIDVGPASSRKLSNAANFNSFDNESLFMIRGQFMF
jgi:phosphate-selective porin OprO/OprP